jgi:hypothetical protein
VSSARASRITQRSESTGGLAVAEGPRAVTDAFQEQRHPLFRTLWYGVNILLLLSIFAVLWSSAWEYSTRRYLKGFSDAIVPFSAPPLQKIQSILNWMSHNPARTGDVPGGVSDDRDPTDTLNYSSLLKVCGTATNAFINLADTAGLTTRRLLLLDSRDLTMHVVAEVLVDGRWIVVDPTFRTIPRASDGSTLTQEDLAIPAVLGAATSPIPGYDPAYTYAHAVHIRVERFGLPGRIVGRILDTVIPGWQSSPLVSLVVERESLSFTILATLAALVLILLRTSLRWYGESRLGIHSHHLRHKLRRLGHLLFEPAD